MTELSLLSPLFVQVALTFLLMGRMGLARVEAVKSGRTRFAEIALGQPAWPDEVLKVSNAFRNQFELPVLFYVLVALVIATQRVDAVFAVLAWVFILSRLVHAIIHCTSNNVLRRFYAFLLGGVVLMAMWFYFGWTMLGPAAN